MRKYFGTDGIRRIANTELTPELVYKVAKAGAYVLSKHTEHTPTIFIGRDTRISGTLIESAMIAGFLSYGANVKTLGVIPTPAVAYLTHKFKADASVVISASHNTYEFNGVKYLIKPVSVKNFILFFLYNLHGYTFRIEIYQPNVGVALF